MIYFQNCNKIKYTFKIVGWPASQFLWYKPTKQRAKMSLCLSNYLGLKYKNLCEYCHMLTQPPFKPILLLHSFHTALPVYLLAVAFLPSLPTLSACFFFISCLCKKNLRFCNATVVLGLYDTLTRPVLKNRRVTDFWRVTPVLSGLIACPIR